MLKYVGNTYVLRSIFIAVDTFTLAITSAEQVADLLLVYLVETHFNPKINLQQHN